MKSDAVKKESARLLTDHYLMHLVLPKKRWRNL